MAIAPNSEVKIRRAPGIVNLQLGSLVSAKTVRFLRNCMVLWSVMACLKSG